LLPVGGRPIIEYIIDKLNKVEELDLIYIVTNHKFFGHFQEWNRIYTGPKKIEIVNDNTTEDGNKLGAIGDIEYVIRNKKIADDLLIIAGDNIFDFEVTEFVSFYKNRGVSIVSYDVGALGLATKYGVVAIDQEGKVTSFEEKPKKPKSTLISMGVYGIPAGKINLIDRYLEEKNNMDAPGRYIKWLSEIDTVYSFIYKGQWFDIGDIDSYKEVERLVSEGELFG